MIIYGIVTRSGVIIGEYGITTDELSQEVLAIIQRNTSSGTRLVPMDGKTCAVMNKSINGEIISFASVIESSDERDISFNFLDSLANFYEKEQSNPKMHSFQFSFLDYFVLFRKSLLENLRS